MNNYVCKIAYLTAFRTIPEYQGKGYFKYGFNEHIKDSKEVYPDGTEIDVEYYGKSLK